MEEDTEYLKLPIEDRCVHKSWKARINGYEECTKLFAKITDEKSPEFTKFAPLIKKFVTDSNAVAQEKALDAVLVYVENAHIAGKTAADATSGIVAKCIASPKRTTQEKAVEVILMYCEIEKCDIVEEELIKGFNHKNPKVICGCIKAVTTALKEFGNKVMAVKPLVKCISPLFENRDKNVRDEAKKMVIEMYRWVGAALRPQLSSLKPIQVQELEVEFEKAAEEKPTQTRYLRSQQELKVKAMNQEVGDEDGDDVEDEEEEAEIDPLDLMSPVNILESLPKDFYEKVEAKKWQERKEVVDALLPLSQNAKLESGDYADLVRALKKIIAKDSNVMIIALSAQCLRGIAKGLNKRFAPFSLSCMETIFEKFKEKKVNVVTALRDAIDAIFQSTNVEAIHEIACAALNNKNPSVKAETASFLARAYCYSTPVVLTKKLLKTYTTELLKTLNEPDPNVRENSANALGTMLKVAGEKSLAPFLSDVDSLKMQKIKEFSEKAEIKVKIKAVKPKPANPTSKESESSTEREPPKRIRGGRPTKSGPSRSVLQPKKGLKSKGPGLQNGNKEVQELGDENFSDDGLENAKSSPSTVSRTSAPRGRGISSRVSTRPDSSGVGRGGRSAAVRPKIGGKVGLLSSRKEEEVDTSPMLQVNALKKQRVLDEQRMRTLRWEFSTPRSDFILQLKEQMSKAAFNQTLFNNMFHQDFKFHIKAIDALAEDLKDNKEACVANLDLILRWLTIRFFDTNPSVILKAMDYLGTVFTILSDENYCLTDYEARAFLPFLVMKSGDPKDSIRCPTKNIVKLICNIYAASKVFPFIVEGLNSKNARQRAECLDTIGFLIDSFGMTVCQPTPPAAMKEVVKQIADRDNSVRNAALNCLLQVYFKQGEKVYKLIGNISDKDRSLLEERIKRSSKNKPVINKITPAECIPVVKGSAAGGVKGKSRVVPLPAAQPPPLRNKNVNDNANDNDDNAPSKRFNLRPTSSDDVRCRLQIDYDYLEKLLEDDRPVEKYQLVEIPDIDSILNSDVTYPTTTSRLSSSRLSSTMNANVANANVDTEEASSHAINTVISQVTSTDMKTVISALSQLNEVVVSKEKQSYLVPHVDQLLVVFSFQYRHILNTKMSDSSINKEECIRIYRSLTACLMNVLNVPELAAKASTDVLRDVILVCVNILMDSRLSSLDEWPRLIRAINMLVLGIIQKANFTNIFSALLKLLHDSVKNYENSKFLELVLKCNWKAIRILPSKSQELNPVRILQEVHDFMKAYPSNTWAERPSTTPLQTIKTVLHELVKTYKKEILTYMLQVPNGQNSECHKYLIKDLNRTLTMEKSNDESKNLNATSTAKSTEPVSGNPSKKLPKAVTDTLCEIFTKIGAKESTKEGLRQLYDFQQAHPETDITVCLRSSSQHFRNYIERGLKRVEMERKENNAFSAGTDEHQVASAGVNNSSETDKSDQFDLNIMLDDFKSLAVRAGFDNNYIDSAVKNIIGK